MAIRLSRLNPEEAGVSSRAVVNFLEAVRAAGHEMHGFMLLKGGSVICERWWEPYGPAYRHQLFSLSKSFTSTAVGMAAAEGLLTADTLLSDIFKAEFEELGPRMDGETRGMTVKHLLTMSTGQEYEAWKQKPADSNILSFLSAHIKEKPGQVFRYNTLATYMLSAAVTRLTGLSLAEYLKPRLFDPLGITAYWSHDEENGVSMGGYGLTVTTEDIAKFGQFILQKGLWQGRQLLPAAWVEEATAKQIDNSNHGTQDWGMGYGYQFWRCQPDGVFRGDGAFGQYCVVAPKQDVVIAANSNADMQAVLNLYWKLLEDMETLPADGDGAAQLRAQRRLTHLTEDESAADFPAFFAEYACDALELNAVSFDFTARDGVVHLFAPDGPVTALTTRFVTSCFYVEPGRWTRGAALSNRMEPKNNRVRAHCVWEGNVCTLSVWYCETVHHLAARFTFSADYEHVTVETRATPGEAGFTAAGMGKRIRYGA